MPKLGRHHLVGLVVMAGATLASAALPGIAMAKAKPKPKVVGHLYSQTNGLSGNQVVMFNRYANGSVKKAQVISTRGTGGAQQQPGCTATCPQLDTDFEVLLTPNRKLLFAVNAGSNTITSFHVAPSGKLSFAAVVSSVGAFPFSLTSHGNQLYVLNTDSRNITGFTFAANGVMKLILGSVQPLSSDAMPGLSRQIGFDNTGKVLVVTLLMPSKIDTFLVNSSGAAGGAKELTSTTPFPFGFAFDKRNQLVMSQVSSLTSVGSTATYSVSTSTGNLTPLDTKTSNGALPCWAVVSPNQRFAFVANTGNGAPPGATIASYKLSPSGKLTFLGVTPAIKGEYLKTDEFVTPDGRYLYVMAHRGPNSGPANDSHIDEYRVASNGVLVYLGKTSNQGLALGLDGLVGF